MDVPAIRTGLVLCDPEGDEVEITKINLKKKVVTLESDDRESYTVPLRDLRKGLLCGEYGTVVEHGEEAEGEADEAEAND